ncbi:DUF5677 domain-containing protein [Pedobacter steynii]|uniref:Uncharacterized protein n=1 Tax=Pedobacter steynii TaxID=430522 RepID=A0A1D7QFC1_9SPHI|nr:DUF5677 domain-containing protein [Pedobacter steynii]AOM77392.1 hypothetical protein BFS30_09570 [Pedobacter steynii]
METKRETIFSRALSAGDKVQLKELSSALDCTVDLGVALLEADFATGGNELDLPPILFLKNLISNIDGISVLVENSIMEPCNVLLRTLLENFFSLEYLLEDKAGSGQRSRDFMVWDFVERRKWVKKGDVNSPEHGRLAKKFKQDKRLYDSPVMSFPMADKICERIDKGLNGETYRETWLEYERTRKIKRKTPAWYSLSNGPGSLEELAAKVGYPALYEILYRGFSSSSHGNNIVPGKISFPDGPQVNLEPLRDKTLAASTVNHCLQISNLAFRTYLKKRVPFMEKNYEEWVAYAYPYSTQLNNEVREMVKKDDQWLLDKMELNKRPPIIM